MNVDSSARVASDSVKGNRIQVAPAPFWVERSKVRSASRRAGAPITCLLSERRIHVPSQTTYTRHVNRLETPQAVQQLSRVEIPFDPEIQTVAVHSIGIFRNGQLTNHAVLEDFEVMRREQRLDSGILNGELSALLLLKDVRTGDILDVEFSVTDAGGLFGDEMSWLQGTEQAFPVGDWKFEWIDEATKTPRISAKPEHLSYSESESGNLLIRQWSAAEIPAVEPEENLPADIFPVSILQVSTFESWGDLVERLLDRWSFAPASRAELDVELSSIRLAAGDDPAKLVDLAVSAARDAVRYQSYSPGLLAMVPEDLSKVWHRRYGDCKEKALLLSWLLRESGIDAVPVLVNSGMGKALPKLLPGPGLFDHVVTRVALEGKELWIDATDLYRGGRPSTWTNLPYAWGLPLAKGASDLVPIPETPSGETYLKVKEQVKPDSKTRAVAMNITILSGGRRADWLRGLVDSQGMPGVQKFLKGFMETTRRGVELVDDPAFDDDREKNEITLQVNARVSQGVQQDPEYARDRVLLAPFSFSGVLAGFNEPKRKGPLSLGALDRIEHEIEVDHPDVTKADYPRQTVKNPAFELDAGSRLDGRRPVFWFACSTLADRVETAELTKYKSAVERAFGILDVVLTLPSRGRKNVQTMDPENRWGGGIPSPRAARVGQAAESVNIVRYVCIGIVVIAAIIRIVMIFAR